MRTTRRWPERTAWTLGFLVAALLRIIFLRAFAGNFDVGSYEIVASIIRAGGRLYEETDRYRYSPIWAFALGGFGWLARSLGCSLALIVGTVLNLGDLLTARVLFELGGRGRRGLSAALLFFLNPVSIFVSSYRLSFDNLSILFLLLAVYGSRRSASKIAVTSLLSVSFLLKHITAFFPPLFVGSGKRRGLPMLAAMAPYGIFLASFLPFWRSWPAIYRNVFQYRGGIEEYGVGILRAVTAIPSWAPSALFLAAMVSAVIVLRRLELTRACLMLFLVMLIFTPGVCEYYFVWPIALGSLYGGAGYFVYTTVVSSFFLGSPDGLRLELRHLPGWQGVWWSLVFWYAWEQRRLSRGASTRQGSRGA